MTAPPCVDIDPASFAADPDPALKQRRQKAPVAHVPQQDAVLLTRRDDIFQNE